MGLVGWRDPFIFERKGLEGNGREWGMLLGSGLKDGGGAVMIYRSTNLRGGAPRLPGRGSTLPLPVWRRACSLAQPVRGR